MSPGKRSGVNWMRLNSSPSTVAKLRATSVLPRPGKSSSRMCPPASMDDIIISSRARLPTTARSTSAITCLLSDETWDISVTIDSDAKRSFQYAVGLSSVRTSQTRPATFHLRFNEIHRLRNIQVKWGLLRRSQGTVDHGKIRKRSMQTSLEIFLQFLRWFPIVPQQRGKDRAGPAAFTVEQNLVGKFAQPVGNQPFEISAALRLPQPYGKQFHLPLKRFGFFDGPAAELRPWHKAEDKHEKNNKKDDPPPGGLRQRTIQQAKVPDNVCGWDHHSFIDRIAQREGHQAGNDQNTGQNDPAPRRSHTGSPQ